VKRTHFGFWRAVLLILGVLVLLAGIFVVTVVVSSGGAQGEAEKTRQELKKQGFKTDLTEFDFSVPTSEQGFQASLARWQENWMGPRPLPNVLVRLPLMRRAGPDSAIVTWQEDSVVSADVPYSWDEFAAADEFNLPDFIEARAAAYSRPIRFHLEANRGMAMLLGHLPAMQFLSQNLGSAMVVDLHNKDRVPAWTNLVASTRLVTAWEPEPAEPSLAVHFALMPITLQTTWEALQAGGWSEEQLSTLQRAWESVDFFKDLPATIAFKRAGAVDLCENQQKGMPGNFKMGDVLREMAQAPRQSPQLIRMFWSQWRYLNGGMYDDEVALLLFYRDREVEFKNAVKAPSWQTMQSMPGVTNQPTFTSKYSSRISAMLNVRQLGMAMVNHGGGLLGRAAEAEAYRRIIITAIALERFRARHGHYPFTLDELAPEFLKQSPIDFMDGQPLRYHLGADGKFVLYSTGLDCVDDGGIIPKEADAESLRAPVRIFSEPARGGDLVWPRPATTNEIATLRAQELEERQQETEFNQKRLSEDYWNATAMRQARADSSFVTPEAEINDQSLKGRRVDETLRNENVPGTNSLTEMLTLHPVITGAEGETITFEAPIKFDSLTNVGALSLLIDASKSDEDRDEGSSAAQVEVSRATNGDCLLAWHTIFETPGKHTLQMGLLLRDGNWEKMLAGPVMMMEVTNLCQFSEASANFDHNTGAWLIARLPEMKANFSAEMFTTDGKRVKTISGSTSNGVMQVFWDLVGDDKRKLADESFNTIFHITLPESGRTQTLKGP
jgi:hypothetical protein